MSTHIDSKRWFFVDFFDTTIFRRVTVEQAIYRWAVCIKRIIPCIDYLDVDQITKYRKESFILATHSCDEPTYEKAMSYMYDLLHIKNDDISKDSFVKKTKAVEMAIEYGCQYPNYKLIKKLRRKKQQGVRLVCVSDFYMGNNCLKDFLCNCNIEDDLFDSYFVSCECGRSKAKGTIYEYIIDSLGIKDRTQIVMIGDYKESDYDNAKKSGIKAVLKRNVIHKTLIRAKKTLSIQYETRQLICIAKFGYKRGYCFSEYVLAFYYFIKQLYIKLREDNVSVAAFMAREGYYLLDLFGLYSDLCLPESEQIKTMYFKCSRRSVYSGVSEDIKSDEKQEPISIRNWLKSIDFSVEELKKYVKVCESELDKVGYINESQVYIQVMNDPEFVNEYKKRVTQNREAFLSYIKDYIKGDRLSIVDSGWKGTTQTALLKYYNIPSTGYYLGTQKNENFPNGILRYGLLFDEDKGGYYDYIGMNFPFYQQILAAPHGSAIKYKKCNDSVEVIEEWDRLEKQLYYKYIETFQNHVRSLFMGICVWSELDAEKEEWLVAKTLFHSNMFAFGSRLEFARACENSFYINFLQERKGPKNYDYRAVRIKPDIIYNPQKYIRYITKIQRSTLYNKRIVRIAYPIFAIIFYYYSLLVHAFRIFLRRE